MLRLLKKSRGQSIMEYALLFTIVIGAFSVMQLYFRRSMNAKLKGGADNAANYVLTTQAELPADTLFVAGDTQYEPYYTQAEGASSTFTSTTGSGTETGAQGAAGGQRVLTGATRERKGKQTIVGAYDEVVD